MATTLGTAYVQIMPSSKGIKGSITNVLAPEAQSAGKSSGKVISDKMSAALKRGAKVAGAALVAGIASAIKQGAQLEQSIGGIETLYKESTNKMMSYANKAFKTTGLSANEYMEQVTSFSASLLQATGGNTSKTADSANQAMIDMSDNANKMGTDMERITDAYQGFAKQNYTMLDNLKLGYGGTKTEMQRLLSDAQKITGVKYDISNLNDVYSAIHVIQGELGITGTTAKEASGTISGSLNMLKASWNDLLANAALGNDLSQYTKNFTESFNTVLQNIMPAISNTLSAFFRDVLPVLIPAAISLGKELISAIAEGLKDSGPIGIAIGAALTAGAASKIITMVQSIATPLTQVVGKAGSMFSSLGGVTKGAGASSGMAGTSTIKNTLKGLASAGIILAGMTAVVVAYGALSKIPGFTNLVSAGGEMLKAVFSAVAQIASAKTLAMIAAIEVLGLLSPSVALAGIASLAVIIGGMTAIVTAFGAISQIPGIQQFVSGGGDLLANIMTQIGRAVGAIVNGFAVEATSGLPTIGKSLSGFATNAKPFFDLVAKADFSGMKGFASGLLALTGVDLINKFESFFGSGLDFGSIGSELSEFAKNVKPYFDTAASIEDMSAGVKLMSMSNKIKSLVSAAQEYEKGWGEADLSGLASALTSFATKIEPFFKKAAELPDMEAGVKLMSISGKIKKLVSAAQEYEKGWGEADLSGLASALTSFAGKIAPFFTKASAITDMDAGVKLMSTAGKIKKLVSAAKTEQKIGKTALGDLADSLKSFASKMKSFFTAAGNIKNWDAGQKLLDKTSDFRSLAKIGKSYKEGSLAKFGTDLIKFAACTVSFYSIMSKVEGGSYDFSGIISKIKNLASKFKTASKSVATSAKFTGLKGNLSSAVKLVTSARKNIIAQLNKLSKAFSKVKFSFTQHIDIPHFSMSGSFNAKKKTVPSVKTKWYAKGGIVDGATLIGAGEAGAEAIVPLEKNTGWIDAIADKMGQRGNTFNITMHVDGAKDPEVYAVEFSRTLKRMVRMGTV